MTTLKLLDHQLLVVNWAAHREENPIHGACGGIPYLKMGLGKTPIGMALCSGTRNLVVVPKGLLEVWKDHLTKWHPDRKVIYLHKDYMGKTRYDNLTFDDMVNSHIVVTTYDVVQGVDRKHNYRHSEVVSVYGEGLMTNKVIEIKCRRSLIEDPNATGENLIYAINWHRIVADESHRFGNPKTLIYKAMMALSGKKRWALTGTIIRNKDTDLWSLLRFVGYRNCPAAKDWSDKRYFAEKLNKLVFQMDYEEAKIQLPPRHDHELTYKFSEQEQKTYDIVKERVVAAYNDMMLGGTNYMAVLASFTRLRQICIASYLICPESKRSWHPSSSSTDEKAQQELNQATEGLESWIHDKNGQAGIGSAKITALLEIIDKIPTTEKVIVFSMWTSALDLVDDALTAKKVKIGVARLDGDSTIKQRKEAIEAFKNDPNCRILLANSKTAGEGLTLTIANHAILLEPWWTNAAHEQNFSRIYRFPQEQECHTYTLMAENSIETNMISEICRKKIAIRDKFFGNSEQDTDADGGRPPKLGKEIMGQILGIN